MNRKRYQVIDTPTQQVMATYSSWAAAARKADYLDLEYGAVRYVVVVVPAKA